MHSVYLNIVKKTIYSRPGERNVIVSMDEIEILPIGCDDCSTIVSG